MLGVGGVGLFCGRVHLQTRETKENQGKPRKTQGKPKGNQGKPKGNQGKPRETKENPRKTKENPFNQQKKYLPINGSIFNQ
jgi:hypothetical protein